jgi:hypothetical protein
MISISIMLVIVIFVAIAVGGLIWAVREEYKDVKK